MNVDKYAKGGMSVSEILACRQSERMSWASNRLQSESFSNSKRHPLGAREALSK